MMTGFRAKVTTLVAHALFAIGFQRVAIKLLGNVARKSANVAVERKLVDLLLLAGKKVSPEANVYRVKKGASRLEDFEVPAEEAIIPEIDARELNAEVLRNAIDRHGHLIVRNFFPRDAVGQFKENIDKALFSRAEKVNGTYKQENEPWYFASPNFPGTHVSFSRLRANKKQKFTRTGSIRVVDSPRSTIQLIETFRKLQLDRLLQAYFSDTPVVATRKWMFRLVEPDPERAHPIGDGWHQDGQFMGESVRAINLWVSLSHCGDSAPAPGLALVPRRFRKVVEFGTRGANLDWTVGRELVAELSRDTPVVRPYFGPGDAIFFDHFSLHRTGFAANQTENRYAIESWFYAASDRLGGPIMKIFSS